jgi:capsular polysaccharide biosynthesis protein
VSPENSAQLSGVDAVIAAVWRRRLMVMAVSLLFAIGAYVVAHFATPIYRGKTVLAPADLDKKSGSSGLGSALGSVGGFAALAGLGLGGNDYATEDLLPELFPVNWDPVAKHWRPEKKVPTLGAGFRAFDRVRKVQKDNKTGLITVQIDWRNPITAAKLTNDLVERLNDEMRRRALVEADASMGYLQHENATMIDVNTREAISRLMEDQIKQEMLAHVTKEYALKVVDRALPADLDAPVKPIKVLYIAVGLFLGALFGAAIALRLDKRAVRRS